MVWDSFDFFYSTGLQFIEIVVLQNWHEQIRRSFVGSFSENGIGNSLNIHWILSSVECTKIRGFKIMEDRMDSSLLAAPARNKENL